MILMDGKKLADEMLAELKTRIAASKKKLRLGVVVVGDDPVVRHFIAQKKKTGEEIGIDVRVYPFPETISTTELRGRVAEIVHEPHNTGVIIQLPLPVAINKQYILNAVVPSKDVDVLSARAIGDFVVGKSRVVPPVVGAVKALFAAYDIAYASKQIAILGAGALVGRPVALWLLQEGVSLNVVQETTTHPEPILRGADIIITGIGIPGFVTGDMVQDGVIIIDAGTSESEGKMRGDADFDLVAPKASFITPVPGGVGPLTVATLFRNLSILGE